MKENETMENSQFIEFIKKWVEDQNQRIENESVKWNIGEPRTDSIFLGKGSIGKTQHNSISYTLLNKTPRVSLDYRKRHEAKSEFYTTLFEKLKTAFDTQEYKVENSQGTNEVVKQSGIYIVFGKTEDGRSWDGNSLKEALDKMQEFSEKEIDKYLDVVKSCEQEFNIEAVMSDEEQKENIKNLLLQNHNIILHGAPGTGKTYLAKEIAKELIFSTEAGFSAEDKALIEKKESEVGETEKERFATLKKQFNEQCGFVQFHQSYDYTDFVEGLRPTKDSNDKVDGFELKPGIFRTFCEKAVKNIEDSNKKISESKDEKNFNSKFNKVVNQIKNDDLETIELKTGKKMIVIDVSRSNTILLKTEGTTSNRVYRVSFNRLAKLAQKYPTIESMNVSNIDEAVKEVIGGSHSSAYWAVLKFIHSQKLDVDVKDHKKIELRTFVFVIDEINRGEMSKIFGELFFSIDPGYRGKKGAIRTQYANLQDEANDFDSALGILDDNDENFGHFFVPENVYIIGTMNDIDRSVESMDFAMRRRFAFKEITAEESQESMFSTAEQWKKSTKTDVIIDENLLDDIKNRMNNLNKAILNKEFNLGHAYQIGGAYFLKFANYFDQKKDNAADAFDSLWTNHLQCILREYLRGMDNVEGDDGLLKKLENAYKEPDKYKYGKNGELEEKNASQPAAVNPGDEKGDGE